MGVKSGLLATKRPYNPSKPSKTRQKPYLLYYNNSYRIAKTLKNNQFFGHYSDHQIHHFSPKILQIPKSSVQLLYYNKSKSAKNDFLYYNK
jgi:hypothetical protein